MKARILVIDDEESLCDILKYNLEKEGYEVDCAYSAEDALEMNLMPYQLFIVDIMMEQVSGYDFVRRIRHKLDTKFMPVIFCSALSDDEAKVKGLDIGADDYITKPFKIKEVSMRVKKVLHRCYPELYK